MEQGPTADDGRAGEAWRPVVFDPTTHGDDVARLVADPSVRVHDTYDGQLRDLVRTRAPGQVLSESELEARVTSLHERQLDRWVHYPWSGRLVRLLAPEPFRELRLDRNRLKITVQEEARLRSIAVGVVGLSVGNAVATTLALEGVVGHLRLADHDHLDLSNMNRIRAGVESIGVRKTVLAARQVFETDPYASISLLHDGVTADNVDAFLDGSDELGPALDVVVDECDAFAVKFLVREHARARGVPVLMETSDCSVLDVERFDVEPDRPLFHGRVGSLTSADVAAMAGSTEGGLPDGLAAVALQVMGSDTLSARMAASLFEVGVTVSTWPQLASEVVLGGASVTAAVRRLGLGLSLPSGRRVLDLDAAITHPRPEPRTTDPDPQLLDRPEATTATGPALPPLVQHVVAHAILAPSGGNCQPWRFVWQGDHLDVVHDAARSRSWLDHSGGAARLALGAAIENAVIAAAARDHATDVVLEPDPADPAVVARLRFQPSDAPAIERMAAWLPAVTARRTDRRLGMREELADDDAIALSAAAAVHECSLQLRTDPAELFELGSLLGAGDRVRMLNPALHHDMIGELRWDDDEARETADGLTLSSLGLPPGLDVGLRLLARPDVADVLRRLDVGHRLELGAVARAATASALCLLTTQDPSPLGWLRGGRAMQRVWLAATRRGLAMQPMTAMLHMLELVDAGVDILEESEVDTLQQLRKRMYRVFDAPTGAALMLFRVARLPNEAEVSLRRPVGAVTSLGRGGTP